MSRPPYQPQRKFSVAPPELVQGLPRQVVLARDAAGTPTRTVPVYYFTKDLLRTGHYEHPTDGWSEDITPPRLDAYVQAFTRCAEAGVKVPFVVDHSDATDDGRGEVLRMWRKGDTLYGLISIVGDDAAVQAARVPEVSVGIDHVVDGRGNDLGECIEHVSHSQYPVLPKQQPFQPLAAAGRRRGKAITLYAAMRSSDMALKPELKEKLQAKVVASGKTVDEAAAMSDDDLVNWALETWLGEGEPTDEPAMAGQVETLTREKQELSTKVGDLTEQVKQLSRKGDQPPAEHEDTLYERSIRVGKYPKDLLQTGNYDAATVAKLTTEFVKGADGKLVTKMLSRQPGEADCFAAKVFEILLANNPPPKDEKTGPQRMELSRHTVSGDDPAKVREDGVKEGRAYQEHLQQQRGFAVAK